MMHTVKTLKTHGLFIAIMVFLVAAFGFLIWNEERVVQTGSEVILATRPVDPRDLFRGEYVILRYEIETNGLVDDVIAYLDDTTPVYVRLSDTPGTPAEVVGVSIGTPNLNTGIWLEGEVSRGALRFPDLEQYYVPEGAGTPIERLGSDIHVRVAIKAGTGRVLELLDADLQPIDPHDYLESE